MVQTSFNHKNQSDDESECEMRRDCFTSFLMKQKVENLPHVAIVILIELCDCSLGDGNFHVQWNQLTRSRMLDKERAQKARTTVVISEENSMQFKENRVHLKRYAYLLWVAECRRIDSRNAWSKYFNQFLWCWRIDIKAHCMKKAKSSYSSPIKRCDLFRIWKHTAS